LAKKLAEVTPDGFNHVFFTNSGSEANDTVMRTVRRFWRVQDKPEKRVIISRKEAYHGSTVAAASLGGQAFAHEMDGLPIPEIAHIDHPYWYGKGGDLSPDEFGLKTAQCLETKIKEIGPEKVAAFIGEPVQGAGGVIVPPDTYWPEIQRICNKYGILLIADEVICGFGRTGNWFGSETFGIKPDMMPIAKGLSSGYLPIGGVMMHDRVMDVLIEKGGDFAHGFTYSGHPASCAVALENLKIIEDEKLVEKVANETGPYLKKRWQEFESHPLVGEVRNVGLLGAIELVENKEKRQFFPSDKKVGDACKTFCFENNLVMRALKDTMVVSPPLTMTVEQIDEMHDLVKLCLDLTADKFGIS
jgi:putrescine aminotransferase